MPTSTGDSFVKIAAHIFQCLGFALILLFGFDAYAAPAQKIWKGNTSVWDNGITANWLSNGIASTYADGDFVMFDDTATGYTVAGTNLQPGSVFFTNSTHNYIISASTNTIGGATAVTKLGAGTLTFNGTNTFSGGLNIVAGTVAIGVANSTNSFLGTGTVTLGDSAGNNIATLYVSAASGGTGLTNSLVVAAGTTGILTIAGNNSSINLSGSVALNNNLTLTNANTGKIINFLGTTTCANSPPLTITSAGGNTGPNTFSGGVVIGSGGLTLANNSTKTLTLGPGNITGTGCLTNSGTGTNTTINGSLGGDIGNIIQNSATSALILSGANSAFTNNVFINAGIMTASGATSLNAANLVTLSTGGILDMQNSLSIAGLQDGSGAGTLTNASITARTLTLTGSGNYSFGGTIADGANGGVRTTTLIKNGNGTQIFSGANTYTGSTSVSNGALLVNGSISTNTVTVAVGAILGGRGTIGGLVNIAENAILSPSLGLGGKNTLTLPSTATNALTLNGGNGNLAFAISTNATALTNEQIKIAGTLILNGVNTIALSFPNGLPPAGNYTLMTYGATNGSGTLALNGSYLNTTLAVTSTNVQLIVSSTNSSLTWQGQNSGTWDTTTTNWISGSSPADFSNGSQVTFDDTASSFAVTNSGVLPATVTLNNSLNNYTFTSSGGGISGSTGLTKYGTGTLTLNGANSFSGDMVINGGSVMLGNASALAGSTVAINLANGLGFAVNAVTLGNLNGSGSFALNNGASLVNLTLGGNNASTIYSGNLTGTGSLIKTGAGIFTLTGNNAIGGNTTVSNGTLVVNGSLAANALNVFGSTLSGTGTITGPVTVGAGGTLFPTGNWVIHGAVSLGAGSTTVMQLGTAATMVRGVSSLTYGGTLVITNTTGASLVAGSSFKIFDAAPYSGSFTSSNLPPLGTGLSWYLNDLTNYGTIRVVSAWTVAGMFNNNMVLQRGISVPVWGTALPGQSVTVTFGGQTKTTTAGTDRKWLVRLDAMAANTNAQSLTVTIAGSTTNTYSNVLVGEVWLAAGQSNMVLPLQSMTNATAEIAAANYPLMRRLPVPNTASGGSITPIWQMSSTPWEVCSPTTAPNWSGAAYFFARNLFTNLNVPVGILQSAVNGTTAETRTSFEALEAVPELKTMADQELEQYYEGNVVIGSTATGLFNTMIWPLIPFGICGAIYYQGEANSTTSDRCQQYRVLLPAMIQDWRSRWQQADFPSYEGN